MTLIVLAVVLGIIAAIWWPRRSDASDVPEVPEDTVVTRLRRTSHYRSLRLAIHLFSWVYIASAVAGLLVRIPGILPRALQTGRSPDEMVLLLSAIVAMVHVVGALVVREFLQMVVDWFDGAIQRRQAGPGPNAP